jgi:hypothetical protein
MSYLVSNAIVLPISGWLANDLGPKRMRLTCVSGFTLTALCCGLATTLPQLIIFPVLQGLTGGGLQPLAPAILLETLPKERHGHAMAAFGDRDSAGPDSRAHARRMDHRQLHLALDFLSQSPGRHYLLVPHEPVCIFGDSVFWPSASAHSKSCSIPASVRIGFPPTTFATSPCGA